MMRKTMWLLRLQQLRTSGFTRQVGTKPTTNWSSVDIGIRPTMLILPIEVFLPCYTLMLC